MRVSDASPPPPFFFCLTSYGQLPGIPMVAGIDLMENSAQQLATFVDKGT